jgi:RimJ/RimL family protein N-acetyltransferase
VFKYDNIVYRKLGREHLQKLLELKMESWSYTHNTTIANLDDQNRWFDSLDSDVHCPRNLVLTARDAPNGQWSDSDVGQLNSIIGIFKIFNINYVNGSADVAWDVLKDFRHNGYGKRIVAGGVRFCVDVLNLRRLSAEILERNESSMKCAMAAGFKREGVKIKAVYKSGVYVDSIMLGYV